MSKRKKYTPEEAAEGLIFPVAVDAATRADDARALAEARRKGQREMSEQDRVKLELLQFKYQLESYIEGRKYDPEKHFGFFLKSYIDILGVKRKAFAADISIDETLLSQFINMHRMPPDYITIRLELHSNNIIPAIYWFRLVEKQQEFQIETNQDLRKEQRAFVHQLAC